MDMELNIIVPLKDNEGNLEYRKSKLSCRTKDIKNITHYIDTNGAIKSSVCVMLIEGLGDVIINKPYTVARKQYVVLKTLRNGVGRSIGFIK